MTPTSPHPNDLPAGTRCGNYGLQRLLGRGGMGTVYEAVHETIGQRAAVKVLRAEIADEGEAAERFFAEARVVGQVPHPSLVRIFDYGRLASGELFLIMELLGGESLRARLAAGPRPLAEALDLGWQVADALCAVHQAGVVHRDLKPENLHVLPDPVAPRGERVKVLDFGIAKQQDPGLRDLQGEPALTTAGRMLGTPLYMAPEQCEGRPVTAQADVYSLGVVLYELVAGGPPFAGPSGVAVLAQHLLQPPPPLVEKAPGCPEGLRALIHAMLAKRPEQRPTMAQVAAALRSLPGASPPAGVPTAPPPRPPSPAPSPAPPGRLRAALLVLPLLLLGGVALVLLRRPDPAPTPPVVVALDAAAPSLGALAAPSPAAPPPGGVAPPPPPPPATAPARAQRTVIAGYGRDGEEHAVMVELSAGRCYTFSGVGSGSMRALYGYLWDPRGKRVATEKRSRSPLIRHCARFSGSHKYLLKAAGGEGRLRGVLLGP